MAIIEEKRFESAKEVVDFLRLSNNEWWHNSPKGCPWVFRGQWNASDPLLPAVWRKACDNPLRPLLEKASKMAFLSFNCSEDELRPNERECIRQSAAETQALVQFWRTCTRQGFRLPADPGGAPFDRDWFPDRQTTVSAHLLELQTLAQHHRIPTRLLDWTANPLIAAFFSLSESASRPCQRSDGTLCVFAMDAEAVSKLGFFSTVIDNQPQLTEVVPRTVAGVPNTNPFLLAQRALFTCVDHADEYYMHYSKWPDIEAVIQMHCPCPIAHSPVLYKATLPQRKAGELKLLLAREGISKAGLMPTMDNVSSAVVASWQAGAEGE